MPVSVDRITLHTFRDDDPDLSWLEQDGFDDQGERRQAFADGEWSMVGVRAVAHLTFHYGSVGKSETIESAGLWGVESDSGASYFLDLWREEIGELAGDLEMLGLTTDGVPVEIVSTTDGEEEASTTTYTMRDLVS